MVRRQLVAAPPLSGFQALPHHSSSHDAPMSRDPRCQEDATCTAVAADAADVCCGGQRLLAGITLSAPDCRLVDQLQDFGRRCTEPESVCGIVRWPSGTMCPPAERTDRLPSLRTTA
jgi:hypothetical protein